MQNAFLKKTCYEFTRTAGARDTAITAEKLRADKEKERANKIQRDSERKLKEAR